MNGMGTTNRRHRNRMGANPICGEVRTVRTGEITLNVCTHRGDQTRKDQMYTGSMGHLWKCTQAWHWAGWGEASEMR